MAIQHLTAVPTSCCGAELCPWAHTAPPAPMAAYPCSPDPTPPALLALMCPHPRTLSALVLAVGLQFGEAELSAQQLPGLPGWG